MQDKTQVPSYDVDLGYPVGFYYDASVDNCDSLQVLVSDFENLHYDIKQDLVGVWQEQCIAMSSAGTSLLRQRSFVGDGSYVHTTRHYSSNVSCVEPADSVGTVIGPVLISESGLLAYQIHIYETSNWPGSTISYFSMFYIDENNKLYFGINNLLSSGENPPMFPTDPIYTALDFIRLYTKVP